MTRETMELQALRAGARAAWAMCDVGMKCAAVARLAASAAARSSAQLSDATPESECSWRRVRTEDVDAAPPGRPARPRLVAPAALPRRSMASADGRAALLHAIAHIEFNAINLALDAVWRFDDMPASFYADWIGVAADEARHFAMLQSLLRARGCDYGDFDAHDGLWEMAQRTRGDVLDRMALVPRVLEARGLDATPPIQAKLRQAGDAEAVDVLAVILDEEVGHVALGNHWFAWLCELRGLDPGETFADCLRRYRPATTRSMNRAARLAAGFSEAELQALERRAQPGPV
jgi:uncharacterized ferritin-like protein (DUF455 family)